MESLLCGPPYTTHQSNHSLFGQQGDSTFGQRWNSTIPRPDSSLRDLECLVDGLNLLPHLVVLPLAIILVAFIGHCRNHDYTRLQIRLWVLFPGHSVRWLTILALLFVTMSEKICAEEALDRLTNVYEREKVFLLISPLLLKLIIIYVTMETAKQAEASILLQERYMVSPWEFLQNGFVLLVLLLVVSVLRTGAQATSLAISYNVGQMLKKGLQAI
uniref:Uncharacterized protein n=1 Tax=Branchiostoma floridae TaxID=7739 RepID=C3ZUT6_BRAFL|eukprot:XP_002587670.1 hypothetical protein BRAFLDRAFT_92714 [Branchiostoma floridae]